MSVAPLPLTASTPSPAELAARHLSQRQLQSQQRDGAGVSEGGGGVWQDDDGAPPPANSDVASLMGLGAVPGDQGHEGRDLGDRWDRGVSGPDSEASVWVGRGPDPNVPAVVRGSGAPVGTRSPSMEAGIGKGTTTATGMGTHPLRNCAPGMEAGGEQRMSNGSRRNAERVASGAKAGASEELNRKISLKVRART